MPDAPPVTVAFALGWHLAELYSGHLSAEKPAYDTAPDNLPGLGDLGGYETVQLGVDQISAELQLLGGVCIATGVTLPQIPESLTSHGTAQERDALKIAIVQFHVELLEKLTAADFRLGKAYGLGRALADTTLLPIPKQPETFAYAFNPGRIQTLTQWLDDLTVSFPTDAAAAAARALEAWVSWVAEPMIAGQSVAISDGGEDLTRALHGQGRLWRGLLSNEKPGTSLLGIDDYVAAASGLIRRTSRIALNFLRTWWWLALLLLALTGVVGWLVFANLSGSSKTATAIIGFLGLLGITWKSISASLGNVLTRTEPHLWDGEVKEAICRAATRIPNKWPTAASADHPAIASPPLGGALANSGQAKEPT